jgi:ankyrin repeat protein
MNLLTASEKGDLVKVKYYLKIGDIEEKDFYGNTGLFLAARNGHRAVVEVLIESGSNVNSINYVIVK